MSAAIATFVPAHPRAQSRPGPQASAACAPNLSLASTPAVETPPVSERRREDAELVASILAGEEGAFDRLHALYAQRLYRFAVKRLGDASEAEDVVQDTLLEVHRCLASWEGRSTLLTWMFGIAHHQLCRRFRKKTPIVIPAEQLESRPSTSAEMPSEGRIDAHRVLEVCAETLEEAVSPAQREIFELYYGENRATKEIAADLGKSNQAIKISLFRTRRAMEARLEALDLAVTA
jgi:RNA polymerase sigma-70 factor (ECF subfamily)